MEYRTTIYTPSLQKDKRKKDMKEKLETFIELAHLDVTDDVKNELRKNLKPTKSGFRTYSDSSNDIKIVNTNNDTKMTVVFERQLDNGVIYIETGIFRINGETISTSLKGKFYIKDKLIATLFKDEVKYSSLGKKLISNGYNESPFMWTSEQVKDVK